MILLIFLSVKQIYSSPITFTKLEKRKRSDVCKQFKTNYIKNYGPTWKSTGTEQCSLGEYDESNDHEISLKMLTYFRYLAGLERAVTFDTQYTESLRKCALVNNYVGYPTHYPPAITPCYDNDVKTTCSQSNIGSGQVNGADDIEMYIYDINVDNLGHRRWALNPRAKTFGMGRYDKYGAMKVTGMLSNVPETDVPFVA